MLVLRNAITRPYWTQMYDYVCNRITRLPSHYVGSGVCRIDSGRSYKIYYLVDEAGFPISWLYLSQRKGWRAWEVAQIWTFPQHRGKRLAERLYKAAINLDGILLASGNLHTQYSQAMWRRFISKGLFNIWAQDFKNLERTSTVEVEDDELFCDLEIYQPPKLHRPRRTDVRLLALRKD